MRRVACYAAESRASAGEDLAASLANLISVVERWLQRKGLDALDVGNRTFALRQGRPATITALYYEATEAAEWDIAVEEPTTSGRFLTRIVLGCLGGELHLFVELRAGADGYQIAPMSVDVRCPQVLRDLLSMRTWTVGKTPVSVKPVRWTSEAGGNRLLAVIGHKERNLPVVVVSEHLGRPITAALPDELARDLSGLVIVVHIDEAAGWSITRRRGKEWSCFDGAVRIYWPIQRTSGSAYDHPYWTRQRLLDSTGSENAAALGIRNELRTRLLELSTYAVDEPVQLVRIRDSAQRRQFEQAKSAAKEKGDFEALSDELSERCVALEEKLSERNENIERLQDAVRSLTQAWKYTGGSGQKGLSPEPDRPVDSVADAVDKARHECGSELQFGEDVDQGVRGLAPDAGPPDKVFDHLRTLAEMARARRAGPLGKNMLEWLSDRGIAASNESETVTRSRDEMQKRTWRDGHGRRAFTTHLKPNDGTSPDRCVRIYFEYDDELAKVIVGWVGRHP